jgi:hypothetical protein
VNIPDAKSMALPSFTNAKSNGIFANADRELFLWT